MGVVVGRWLYLGGVKAAQGLVGDKTLKPSAGFVGATQASSALVYGYPVATLGITAQYCPPSSYGGACDLDVELGPAFYVTEEGSGLFVLPPLRDLSSSGNKKSRAINSICKCKSCFIIF